ncbi:MAG: citrate/2-methylcitrate synthase, partial [Sphaerochaetaceae bacterium]|nr:citrate/2-methylcitrate synthase [Sphaerochaetaceae bacterium]
RHGGANQAVIQTLEYMIHNNVNPDQMIERAKSKDNSFRLPGFGHRIYKTYDPRAKIAKKLCRDVIDTTHGSSQLLDIALELEAKVLKDDFFLERNLYPNVDFYTGITYHLMGIPTNMFTVMFAVGRVPGWIAHYLEWKHDPYEMLARPRQVYTGPVARKVIPIGER